MCARGERWRGEWLPYLCTAWSGCWDHPGCPGWVNAAEMGAAQKRATKMVPGLKNVLCCERCDTSVLNFSSKRSLGGDFET